MKIQIWSDVVCPWCYVGKRRLETALEQFDEPFEIEWRSFELDPNAPRELEIELDEVLARKYRMSPARAQQALEHMSEMAAAEGLEFHFEDAKTGNTFDAHRLIHFAKSHGKGAEMKERLLRAYFTEGKAVADVDTLVSLAGEVGLDEEQARAALESDQFAANVRADEMEARQIGVTGVPFFLVDGKFGIPGAQTPDTLAMVLSRALNERVEVAVPDGAICDEDGCEIPADA